MILTLEHCSDEDRGYSLPKRPDNEYYYLHDVKFSPMITRVHGSSIRERTIIHQELVLMCPVRDCVHQPYRSEGALENHLCLVHKFEQAQARRSVSDDVLTKHPQAKIVGIVDTETTSLFPPPFGAPISIGVCWMLLCEDGKLIEAGTAIQCSLINPSVFITPIVGNGKGNWGKEAVAVHNIRPEDVVFSPDLRSDPSLLTSCPYRRRMGNDERCL